jgi:CopG-like RHH_1 or ribbon-helix-helix domain, RHH_5
MFLQGKGIFERNIGCSSMLNKNVSKRFTVTVPDSVFEDLEILADTQGRPTANLAAFLIELGIKQIKESGEFPAKKTVKEKN